MTEPRLPAARRLIEGIRDIYARHADETARWRAIEEAMKPFLTDPGLIARAKTWPQTVESAPRVGNLLFYEDPDLGFVFNATVRKPNLVTNIHDHGRVWTLYGLIEGHETLHHYTRAKDGGLRHLDKTPLGPGEIDAVPPGHIHQEHAGPAQSVAFIIRAQRPGTFDQHQYDPQTGAATVTRGPVQIPHALD